VVIDVVNVVDAVVVIIVIIVIVDVVVIRRRAVAVVAIVVIVVIVVRRAIAVAIIVRRMPAGYDVDRESGGLRGRTGVLGWRGTYLTRSVRSVLLMAAEDLPSLRQFWVVCGGFISPGSGKHAFLATQLYMQVSTPCNCVAKTASLSM